MKILVVEDSKTMQLVIRRTLRQTDLDVERIETAGSGEEALSELEDFEPDVILSDWKMPEMDGFELLQSVREQFPEMPFGFVTSHVSDSMKEKAEQEGIDFYITKPFTAEGLHSVLVPFEASEE